MTEVKNTKITADITSSSDKEQVEYVTFWGQLKGNLEKQTDLSNMLSVIKRSINDLSTKYLRKQDKLTPGDNIVIEKNSEDDLVISGPTYTSQLVNDGEGAQDSEGSFDKFTTRSEVSNIADILDSKVNTKQDKLTQGDGIIIEQDSEGKNIISIQKDSMPGEGNLTIKLNDITIVEFNANAKQDEVANIEIQTVPNAETRWGGKILGLNTEGNEYIFYDFPKELPDIPDSTLNGAVLKVVNGKPEWIVDNNGGVTSNRLKVLYAVDVDENDLIVTSSSTVPARSKLTSTDDYNYNIKQAYCTGFSFIDIINYLNNGYKLYIMDVGRGAGYKIDYVYEPIDVSYRTESDWTLYNINDYIDITSIDLNNLKVRLNSISSISNSRVIAANDDESAGLYIQ